MNNMLYSYDRENLHSILKDSWKQVENARQGIDLSVLKDKRIDNIIVTGLGGSAICGDILKNFLNNELHIPFAINRTYNLPLYAGENTLVIVSSYSGNTEETISALKSAIERKCLIVAMTTGGEVERIAHENRLCTVKLREGFQPRYALYASFFTLLKIMEELSIIGSQDSTVVNIMDLLKRLGNEWGSENGKAFEFAASIKGYIPVIYSVTDLNDSAGKRFKCELNENSKVHVWSAEYPEMNHNEIVGWENVKESGLKYIIITITDDDISLRIKKRIEIMNDLFSKEGVDLLDIKGKSKTFKERLIEVIYFCDWVSYYLALLNKKDPGEIDFIHTLKKRMEE
ncbi:MAG: bifunctional phosphoglucose/phosphomannose isomerase [Spirochaetes bacterium]|nr:bifunctional phosphoglucose/phosphomannose isomerase [Spirochaetota bacterium]